MEFTPGDIVANKFGHVLAVSRVLEDGKVSCVYECNPSVQHLYNISELRLLSKTRGVDMSHWNSSEFADRIKRSMEWAQNVKGLPPKYREPKQKKPKVDLTDLSGLSDEVLAALAAQLSSVETVDATKEESNEGEGNMGRNVE